MNTYTPHQKISKDHDLLKHYEPLVAQLLVNRNITTPEEAQSFLHPEFEKNYDPFLLKDMEKSIERLHTAIENNEKITIYADYDADGIPGSVVLSNLLQKINYSNFDVYIPHRHDEGYGIHIEALEKIKAAGTSLIITIDVGITAHEAGQWCAQNNIDLIITDHHTPLSENKIQNLPRSYSLINPKQTNCSYPDDMICGCAVIFKYVQAFILRYGETYKIPKGWEKWLLDMVGIATISDLVPLRNENRIFAYYGMKVIQAVCKQAGKRPGLKKLVWDAGVNSQYITEEDIAFSITPKINAASRMSHPEEAVKVFQATDQIEAEFQAKHLDNLNKERKKLTKKMTQEALEMLEKNPPEHIIVVGKPDWQTGILGLVASKLVERYKLPAFVWSREGDLIKGSCRSCNGLHLVEIMQGSPSDTFVHFGGHKEAGGFALEPEIIDELKGRLEKSLETFKEEQTEITKDVTSIDAELSTDDITMEQYRALRTLAPFGMGNPKPLFSFKNILIQKVRNFGRDNNHLEIYFHNSFGKEIRGIAFFKTNVDFPRLAVGQNCEILGHLEYSVFMGKHELRLKIVDIL